MVEELPLPTAPTAKTVTPSRESSRPKTTLNLQNIFTAKPQEEKKENEKNGDRPIVSDKPLELNDVKRVWAEFAELRKNQVAEYHLLSHEFELKGNQIILTLTNPVQEDLLQGLRVSLTTYLRDKLSNSSINVTGLLKMDEAKKIVYTNREKFEHLAEKNPALLELKERFGLDPDF